jgi:anti-sigma B factor antagonist
VIADAKFTVHGRTVVAALTGEIDFSNADGLLTATVRFVSSDAELIVLDLSEVDYLDSAGIQLIYRLREDLRARGQSMSLVIPPDSAVDDALRLAGVKGQTQTFETVAQVLDGA